MNVKRSILVKIVVLSIWFECFLPLFSQEKIPLIVSKIQPSVVVIFAYDDKGDTIAQGTGFFVSKNGDVITNYHVFQGASHAEIKTRDGKYYPIVQVVSGDEQLDLIRVHVDIPTKFVKPVKINNSLPTVGERILVVGNPLGLEQTVSDGIVSAIREVPRLGKIIQITAPVSHGSSGSPVINMKGMLIGIVAFQFIKGQNLNFAIPSEMISKLKPIHAQSIAEWKKREIEEWLKTPQGLFYGGLVLVWMEEYEKSLILFEKALKMEPNNPDIYFQIGYCNLKLGKYEEAIKFYKKTLDLMPHYPEAYFNLGLAYTNIGEYYEAVKDFNMYILFESNDPEAYLYLGIAYSSLGQPGQAIMAFERAVYLNPECAEAYYQLGSEYLQLGEYHKSLEYFKQAVRLKPDDPYFHSSLGINYLLIGDKKSAFDEYLILKDLDKKMAKDLFDLIYY